MVVVQILWLTDHRSSSIVSEISGAQETLKIFLETVETNIHLPTSLEPLLLSAKNGMPVDSFALFINFHDPVTE